MYIITTQEDAIIMQEENKASCTSNLEEQCGSNDMWAMTWIYLIILLDSLDLPHHDANPQSCRTSRIEQLSHIMQAL